jgi:hypothetical protein
MESFRLESPAVRAYPLGPGPSRAQGLRFDEALTQGLRRGGQAAGPDARAQAAYEAAQQLVATTFIQPVLDQVRQDPFRSELFHGGFAEDAFQQQLDVQLSQRIVASARDGDSLRSPGLPVVDSVFRKLTARDGQGVAGLGAVHAETDR